MLADGQTVSQETLIAPAHTSVRANREIVAKIGNAAGVTFLWNGQEIPAARRRSRSKNLCLRRHRHARRARHPSPRPEQLTCVELAFVERTLLSAAVAFDVALAVVWTRFLVPFSFFPFFPWLSSLFLLVFRARDPTSQVS